MDSKLTNLGFCTLIVNDSISEIVFYSLSF